MNNKLTLSHRREEPEKSILYLVGTPIGNLNDISYRAINILQKVDVIACEDTRQTMKIMNRYKISNNLISFNKFNSLGKIPLIIDKLKEEKSVALVSDAGMPGICDPGEDLVRVVKENRLNVITVPGPCAAITALVSSGINSSKFIFEGFLPKKKIEREKLLEEISTNEKTTILFESPHRLLKLLKELKLYCGGERKIEVCRELTKKFEEHVGTNIDNAIEFFNEKKIMGEFTIIIQGISKVNQKSFDELSIKKDLHELVEAGLSLSAASKYLARKINLTKNVIYSLY